jgi:hypothetical protein
MSDLRASHESGNVVTGTDRTKSHKTRLGKKGVKDILRAQAENIHGGPDRLFGGHATTTASAGAEKLASPAGAVRLIGSSWRESPLRWCERHPRKDTVTSMLAQIFLAAGVIHHPHRRGLDFIGGSTRAGSARLHLRGCE